MSSTSFKSKTPARDQAAFTAKVISLLLKIPAGKVATFGQIAELAGRPRASRNVGWILKTKSEELNLPWHRVLDWQGHSVFKIGGETYRRQKRRLAKEGVPFQSPQSIDLSTYQWRGPKSRGKAKQPKMFSMSR